jgi:tyrosyl-tRNA synthetase
VVFIVSIDKEVELITEGVDTIVSEEELAEKIKKCRNEKKPMRIKYGADPSAPDIHLGHAVCLYKLKTLQELGHHIIFLIGDFTGMIGDPSGKKKTRPQLTQEEIKENARTYKEQVSKILDVEKTEISYNSGWLSSMSFEDVIRLCSKYTVARLLERDDFSLRFNEGIPIRVHELLYPLSQGYDSVALEIDLEMGGRDQLFNFLLGRDLQREFGQEPQIVLTMPLLTGLDGTQKMSKSLNNQIGITDEPADMFGKVMSIPDESLIEFYKLTSQLPASKIADIIKRIEGEEINPRDAKLDLAKIIVSLYYNKKTSLEAEKEFKKVFVDKEIPTEIDEISISSEDGQVWIVKLIVDCGFASSNSEARRLVEQGAVYIDGERVNDIDTDINIKEEPVLRVGKRKFARIKT